MDYSNRALLTARRLGQRFGVLRPLQRLYRKLAKRDYEESFNAALTKGIRPGHVVWDIGANIGLYTQQFAEAVGQGRVFAFEPSPNAADEIRSRCAKMPNVTVIEVALSDSSGTARFAVEAGTSPTNSLASSNCPGSSQHMIEVRVSKGDDLILAGECAVPNVLKIDIEGFELDALVGLKHTLARPELEAVFIEVHFQQLNRRGLIDAPRRIVQLLRGNGFNVEWCDPSHIAALRTLSQLKI